MESAAFGGHGVACDLVGVFYCAPLLVPAPPLAWLGEGGDRTVVEADVSGHKCRILYNARLEGLDDVQYAGRRGRPTCPRETAGLASPSVRDGQAWRRDFHPLPKASENGISKEASMARKRVLGVRLDDAEWCTMERNCGRLGVSFSDLVRFYISIPIEYHDRLADEADPIIAVDRRSVMELARQVRAWGYHYDGCLHALNIVAAKKFMRPEEAEALVRKAVDELVAIDATRGTLEAAAEALLESPRASFGADRA